MARRLWGESALIAFTILATSCAASPEQIQEALGATQTFEAVLKEGLQQTIRAGMPSPTIPPSPSPVPPSTQTLRPQPTRTPEGLRVIDGQRCYRWDTITLDDVGRTICVWGEPVKQKIDKENGFTWLYFGLSPRDFQFVAYAQEGHYTSWEFEPDDCIFIDGEIHKLGQTPVITVQEGLIWMCD